MAGLKAVDLVEALPAEAALAEWVEAALVEVAVGVVSEAAAEGEGEAALAAREAERRHAGLREYVPPRSARKP